LLEARAMRNVLLLLLAAGCQPAPDGGGPVDAGDPCARAFDNTLKASPTVGENGRAGFAYYSDSLVGLDRPIAAGGASAVAVAILPHDLPTVASVAIADPSVATKKTADVNYDTCGGWAVIQLTSGQPGTTELSLLDGNGDTIDRARITVAATASLEVQRGWSGAGPPLAVAGSRQALHVTTLGSDGNTLVGTGAVKFNFVGAAIPLDATDGPANAAGGDRGTFSGNVGDGEVDADCVDAHVKVPVRFVDRSALSGLGLDGAGRTQPFLFGPGAPLVAVAATVDGAPAWGAECDWTFAPAGARAQVYQDGWIGSFPQTFYSFDGASGTYTATCQLRGTNLASSITVSLP